MGKLKGVDVVAEEVDMDVRPKDLHQQYTTDAHHIGPFDDDQSGGDVPGLMLPWSGEKQHEEKPMHPLLEAGTFGSHHDSRPAAVAVDGRNEPLLADGGDVDVKHKVEEAAGLAVNHIDRPNHQRINRVADGPITQGLPTQIQVVKAEYQQHKQPYIDSALVLGVLAICLDVVDFHKKIWGAKIRNKEISVTLQPKFFGNGKR